MGSEEIARNTLGSCSQLGADDKGQILRQIFGRGFLSGYARGCRTDRHSTSPRWLDRRGQQPGTLWYCRLTVGGERCGEGTSEHA
jgi:hypothetical protein